MTTKFLMPGLVTAAAVATALFAFVPASHADDLGGPVVGASNTEAQQEAYRGYGYGYARPSYSYGYSYGYARPSYSYGYSYGYARPSYSYGYSYGYARPSYGYGYRNW
jgi:hypothetical protein